MAYCPDHDQVMTDRQRYPDVPTDVVAFAELMEDGELLRHITDGRLEEERISATEPITSAEAPASYCNWSVDVKPLTTPGAVAFESAEHEEVCGPFWMSLDNMGSASAVKSNSIPLATAGARTTGPNCTFDFFWNWGRNGSDSVIRLSQFSKVRTAIEQKTLVRCLW